MFADLFAIVRHTPLHLSLTPNGEALCIIVTPLPKGKGADVPALKAPLKIVATPQELQTQFAAEIARYTQAVAEVRASFDLPLDALEAAKKKAAKLEGAKAEKEKKKETAKAARSEAAKKAARTRAERAEEQRRTRERKRTEKKRAWEAALQKRRDAAAARKAKKSASKITLPGATAPAAPVAKGAVKKSARSPAETASKPLPSAPGEPRHLASKPGKAECIADWRALNEKHGELLTRRKFIKAAKTGRRYEKLWKNWEAFIAESSSVAISAAGSRPAVEGQGSEVPPSSSTVAAPAAPEPTLEQRIDAATSADEVLAIARTASPGFEVRDEAGELLYTYRSCPEYGEPLQIPGKPGRYRVIEVNGHNVTARHEPATEGASA
jgi:PRTRC genetic system protein E